MNDRKGLRGPKTKKDIRTDILLLKKNDVDGKLSAKDIREKLLKIHPSSKYIPKERAIYNIIQKNREKVKVDPIDSPWSIGSCEKYNIPADIISTLIEYEQVGQPKFTIRQAKWFAKLKPVVFEMSAAKRPLEDWLSGLTHNPAPHKDLRLALLAIIAYQYAAHEQITELEEDKHQDTSDLDFEIFTKGELHGISVSEIDSLSSEEFERLGGMDISVEELERCGWKVLLAEHLERHGIKVVLEESDERTKQSSPKVKDAGI
ncbi:hypothetical protein ES703_46607 [subsurface metagenome]